MVKYNIYVFRHGQTYFNREHRFTGWKESRLTPLGVKQAKFIAGKLKNKKIRNDSFFVITKRKTNFGYSANLIISIKSII